MASSPIDDESSDDHVDNEERESGQELSQDDSDSDSGSDGSNSDDASSDDSDGGGLLDTMAAEGSDDESSEDSDEEDELGRGVPSSTNAQFPQFCRLPIELRQRIWELFCPELRARHRVLDFSISYGTARHPDAASSFVWTVRDGIALDERTKGVRTVLAVHHESRTMATKAFPHSLSIDAGDGDAVVAFNRDSDVVLISGLVNPDGSHVFHFPGFASEIKNLALSGWNSLDEIDGLAVSNMLGNFDQLDSFFVCLPSGSCRKSKMAWCTSNLINRYHTRTFEREPGFGEDLQWLYCWPDLRNHADFAKFQIQREDVWDNLPEPLDSTLVQKGVKAWPMVVFEFDRGLRKFEMLKTLGVNPDDSDSEGSDEQSEDEDGGDEFGPDLDEYESDGIDDDEIVETYESSDEEGISLEFTSPGPARVNLDAASDDGGSGVHFSSPEPDPEEPETAPVPRGRKRRVVSDSDDESDDDVQPSAKRARTDPIDESEDEEEPVQSQGRSQTRSAWVVISDDEDEDEEDGGALKEEPDANPDESDASSDKEDEEGEDEDSGDDEDEDEDAPPARMSLAERLRLHRQENPIDEEGDEENSEDEDDRSSRTADLDSEDDDDDDERNPFMLNMADESDGEGEPGYDEDDY